MSGSSASGQRSQSSEDTGKRLASWATARAAFVSSKVSFLEPVPNGDRTCRARDSIDEDEVLLELPRELAFEVPTTDAAAVDASFGRLAGPAGVPPDLIQALRPESLRTSGSGPSGKGLAVSLLVHLERLRGDESVFKPYLDSLPSGFPTMPIADTRQPPWSAAATFASSAISGSTASSVASTASVGPVVARADVSEDAADEPWMYRGTGVDLLGRGSGAACSTDGVARMRSIIDEIDPQPRRWWPQGDASADSGGYDHKLLRWAAAAVQSRAHSTKAGGTILIPLADAFNHSPSNPNVEVVEEERMLKVRALCDVAPGEELLLSYGAFSNAELLFNAGFTCWPNDHDCLLISPPALVAAARQRWRCRGQLPPADLEDRLKVLHGDAPPPRLRMEMPLLGGAVPPGLVTLLVGLMLDEATWDSLRVDGSGVGAVKELWTYSFSKGVASAESSTLRSDVLACVGLALRGAVMPRYAATSPEADEESLAAVEAALATTITEGSSSCSRRRVVGMLRRRNVLRVRVGERKILAKLDAVIRSREVVASPKDGMIAATVATTSATPATVTGTLTGLPAVCTSSSISVKASIDSATDTVTREIAEHDKQVDSNEEKESQHETEGKQEDQRSHGVVPLAKRARTTAAHYP